MQTAQDAFNLLLRRHLAPGLRHLGFKGSAQTFVMPSQHYWMLIGIQRSSFNDSSRVSFTLNLTVADKQVWEELQSHHPDGQWPDRPNPNRFYGPTIWQRRIGELLPDESDRWWHMAPDTDIAILADEVLNLVRDVAVPHMQSQVADKDSI